MTLSGHVHLPVIVRPVWTYVLSSLKVVYTLTFRSNIVEWSSFVVADVELAYSWVYFESILSNWLIVQLSESWRELMLEVIKILMTEDRIYRGPGIIEHWSESYSCRALELTLHLLRRRRWMCTVSPSSSIRYHSRSDSLYRLVHFSTLSRHRRVPQMSNWTFQD